MRSPMARELILGGGENIGTAKRTGYCKIEREDLFLVGFFSLVSALEDIGLNMGGYFV